jgi:hypothetical protein
MPPVPRALPSLLTSALPVSPRHAPVRLPRVVVGGRPLPLPSARRRKRRRVKLGLPRRGPVRVVRPRRPPHLLPPQLLCPRLLPQQPVRPLPHGRCLPVLTRGAPLPVRLGV